MISLFGNVPLTLSSADAVQTQLAPSAQHPAVSKKIASLPAPSPWRGWKWFTIGRSKKRLQMLESVSLGEKRFVALVQVDGRQFLIGGAPSNVGMLAELAPEETFHQVLKEATHGLDIPISVSTLAAEQSPKALSAVAEPKVVTPAVASPETPVTVAVKPSPAITMPVPVDTSKAPMAAALSKQASVPVPEPVDPVDPIDPVDLTFDAPVSLSPSLLAAMQAKAQVTEAPVAFVLLKEETPVRIPSVTKPKEIVALELDEAKVVETPKVEPVQKAAFVAAPRFTFQVSQIFSLGMKASSQPVGHKSDPELARRVAAAWNLQGATS